MAAPGTAAWNERAALQGDAYAQYRLGRLYLGGEGVARDEAKAREWFTLAAADGSSLADEALVGLE